MNRSKWKSVGDELFTNKLGVAALITLIVFTLGSIFAFLSGHDPNAMDVLARLKAPGADHWFGTDDYGRDYFARALYGGRVSLLVGFASMIIATGIGVTVGVISGYFGGWIDNLLMRMLDVVMSIPSFLVLLLLSVFLKPSVGNIILIIALLMWMNIARVIRAETMTIKEREYVLYAKASGQSNFGIIWRHILPGLVPVVIVGATNNIASAIMMESSLSFLGFGVQPPNATWGSMLNNAQGYIAQAPYLALFPGLLILLTVLSFNVLGDILRVGFEPKLIRR
ncbi:MULTISPECIES: ABC transporter permease [Paenibacillus]|jgi:peptide/nickel transport system permease protein|uniref:Peptide ABC transporter permease n=1 Tax=Paenibacillus odorifer TaxID=189426 RepID=A0A1R0X5T0_9BACL|nr:MULTISPECIES: ABC transporter permease [Paenibacillus]AIQ72040.1 peptide ABC transporter permease [Paenibacillus odorifer]ETT47181.1 oligopeptide ABC transporter permease [Paenibacillus sp. FSL H8-237]MDH6429489.1 peptide/nickel transport system permease protein [Paenibacillus sp. PastH-4]MDH6445697.1 peptide/nickel transport system permease protein [Paenibacillus sp. PastF-4]MDH6529584.1 peptide/nickel transport system permease protein [Paenibacillus sp. PastH-3]